MESAVDIRSQRRLFPALERQASFNTAPVGLGSTALRDAYRGYQEAWLRDGLDFMRAEQAAGRARELIHRIGPSAVFARVRELQGALRDALAEAGLAPLDMPPARRSHIVALPLGGRDPAKLLGALRAQGVVCSARDGNLRIAPHFYNDVTDVARLMGALRAVAPAHA